MQTVALSAFLCKALCWDEVRNPAGLTGTRLRPYDVPASLCSGGRLPDPKDQRFRTRVRMDMPVRIRQVPPPRECVEIKTTLDVSRNGLLFRTRETYELNSTIWITMPYNPVVELRPPEFPATGPPVSRRPDGDLEIGVQFHSAHADRWAHAPVYVSERRPIHSTEKRAKNRVRMTLPIRVRTERPGADGKLVLGDRERGSVWTEETVTLDVSRTGILFASNKPYRLGQKVWIVMPFQPNSPDALEEPAEVVRFTDRGGVKGVAIRFTGRDVKPV